MTPTIPRRPAVLFLSQVLPYPLDSGPKVRAYHVLRWLAQRADVHLLSFVRPDDPPAALAHLKTVCAAVHVAPMRRGHARDVGHGLAALARGESFIIARDRSAAMFAAVERVVRRGSFAAVHADQLWMAQYAVRVAGPHLRVLDAHNAVWMIFDRLADNARSPIGRRLLRREARKLADYEVRQLELFDRVVFVTEDDRRAVAGAAVAGAPPRAHGVQVVPIGVDMSRRRAVAPEADPRRVTILGTMLWPPNAEGVLWFAQHVWPLVHAAEPSATLMVIGKDPPLAVRRLERSQPGITVAGFVPDLRQALRETAVFAVPLLSGGGMRVKILDAWSWGLPIVSTRVGAEGIDVTDGHDVLLADEPGAFAAATVRLVRDPVLRRRLGAAGRDTAAARYDVARIYDAWAEVYDGVL